LAFVTLYLIFYKTGAIFVPKKTYINTINIEKITRVRLRAPVSFLDLLEMCLYFLIGNLGLVWERKTIPLGKFPKTEWFFPVKNIPSKTYWLATN